jgi:hypothetical protein
VLDLYSPPETLLKWARFADRDFKQRSCTPRLSTLITTIPHDLRCTKRVTFYTVGAFTLKWLIPKVVSEPSAVSVRST